MGKILQTNLLSITVYIIFSVQFGFDGDDKWQDRRDSLLDTLHSNPKAKFVTRGVQFGSEPLFDHVLTAYDLTSQVKSAQNNLAPLGIQVTVSELAYGYQETDNSHLVLDAIDYINIHMLPFFSQKATKGEAILMQGFWSLTDATSFFRQRCMATGDKRYQLVLRGG